MSIFAIVLLVFSIILALKGFKIIKQAEVMIIERFGRFHTILESGIHFIIPIIDSPRGVHWKSIARGVDGRSYAYISKKELT
jgi:regulator of protease activity HflC (stomatin/prohibitin superfamily)